LNSFGTFIATYFPLQKCDIIQLKGANPMHHSDTPIFQDYKYFTLGWNNHKSPLSILRIVSTKESLHHHYCSKEDFNILLLLLLLNPEPIHGSSSNFFSKKLKEASSTFLYPLFQHQNPYIHFAVHVPPCTLMGLPYHLLNS
jgi:hypothetical protein